MKEIVAFCVWLLLVVCISQLVDKPKPRSTVPPVIIEPEPRYWRDAIPLYYQVPETAKREI